MSTHIKKPLKYFNPATGHSDAIRSNDAVATEYFLNNTDSAAVYVNHPLVLQTAESSVWDDGNINSKTPRKGGWDLRRDISLCVSERGKFDEIRFYRCRENGFASCCFGLKTVDSNNVIVTDINLTARDEFVAKYNCKKGSIEDVITFADYIVLGIKPQGLEDLANEIKPLLKENTGIISMLAGTSIQKIENLLGNRSIFRIMPNIPCVIGKGMLICAGNKLISTQDIQQIKTDFSKAVKFVSSKNQN